MWFIIKYIILSISAIVLLHYLLQYLKNTYSIKKIKHASSEIEKYKQIIYEIQNHIPSLTLPSATSTELTIISNASIPPTTTTNNFFSETTKSELMNDLDSFLSAASTDIPTTEEQQQIDDLTKYNTQNNINISFESI
jgi:hypothetical protein